LQLESLRAARPGSYLVTVVNTGLTPAAGSTVAVEPRPGTSSQRPVPPLAAGERATVVVEADPCEQSSVVVVQLDRFRVVDESREDDNRVELACPAADRLG
ncbi:MAG TPA: CARDB domain-containing protein, partial [Solirubrobacteraceae bacterium]|nr:CARDB domain-containing protein [Solirubrobacteraceae bacterium]